jgi:hypothetical protein
MRGVPSLICLKLTLARYRRGHRAIRVVAEFDHHEAKRRIKPQVRIRGLRLHWGMLGFERRLRRVSSRDTCSVTA